MYVITGNGNWDGETDFGESFSKFNSGLGLQDWNTPTSWGPKSKSGTLESSDLDLTASGPLLISGKNLLVGGGKDGVLHLLNTDNMGHLTDAGVQPDWQATSSHIASGEFLDVAGGSTANSALVDQYPANGQTNQQWRVPWVGGGNLKSGGKYELVSVKSGLALEVDQSGKINPLDVDQYAYYGNPWQQWILQAP